MIDEVVVIGDFRLREGANLGEYGRLRGQMLDIVTKIEGFQSAKRYIAEDGEAINVYRFASEASLEEWRTHPEHREIMKRGHEEFYDEVHLQICRVIREVNFQRNEAPGISV